MGGRDKTALRLGGQSLLDLVLSAARPLSRSLIVVGPRRPTEVTGVTFLSEPAPGGGPVPAVAAALDMVEDDSVVLVLAADLPLLTSADLRLLVGALGREPARRAAAARDHRQRPNPLLAAYRATHLRAAVASLGPGAGVATGVAAAELLPPDALVVDVGPLAGFNVNAPEDLRRAGELLDQRTR